MPRVTDELHALGTSTTITAGVGVAGHREAPLVGGDHSSLDPVTCSSAEGVCFRS